jgi:peptide/nickel transport system substrate-binding protein
MSEFRFPHPATAALRTDHRRGKINRREYLALLTSLGSTALVASPALFQRPPAAKAAGESATLRIQSSVGALGDPRSWARPEEANFARGWLEYLVEYRADGSFNGMLLEG